jgi:Family of unknown function (DUF6492)
VPATADADGRRLDAVLPLTAADAPRAQILFRTLETFFEPLATCYVVAPDEEVAAVATQMPRKRYLVLPESDVVPEIGYFRATARLRARLRIVGPPIHGWFVQQLVKLAIFERVATPFYLTLDADVLCVRPTSYQDLVPNGRALVQTSPPNHPEWNDDAERVLTLSRSRRQYAVTPAVLSREAVGALSRHLADRVDPRARALASRLPSRRARRIAASWRSFLLRNLPWTEYAVYHTFLEATGLFDRYHVLGGDEALYARAVWMESQFDDWPAEEIFVRANGFCFTIVQSATRIPPERVLAKVVPHLRARARR